ncbi:hypothetical protein CARUB_v10003958mg, partial [Capsella rubella]
LERLISGKALKLGNSFSCKICVIGFLCGICLTSLFLAAFTSLGTFELAAFFFSSSSSTFLPYNSTTHIINMVSSIDHKLKWNNNANTEDNDDEVNLLVSTWDNLLLNNEDFLKKLGVNKSDVPNAIHLENCEEMSRVRDRLDKRIANQTFPTWINGGDEENYPLTRRVQSDLWIHQHHSDCKNTKLKFLVADWETLHIYGSGAQITEMTGLLAIAINENRILVAKYYNRADHDGCKGTHCSSRGNWSCYFLPETSEECRKRAFAVVRDKEAWESGIVTSKQNYSSKLIWAGPIPKLWGKPWSYMKPTTEINGSLMDRRWWRALAVRYLMRFQTEYTCSLMDIARNTAFGKEAAVIKRKIRTEIEEQVWLNHKPWIPRPILSVHVRMGDKVREMRVAALEEYMCLADRIKDQFPDLKRIWLSTEMKEVVDRSKGYGHWRFYYTEVARQFGNKSMAEYEASLGREISTNYPLINFLMASEADFYVGALGSTWCFLIDGMRNTGGKVMSGYLSVNKYRLW